MKQLFYTAIIIVSLASCRSQADKEAEIQAAKQATIDSIHTITVVKQQTADSVAAVKERHSAADERSSSTTTTTTTEVQKKKGWSNTAKGAVIGAGTGAVAGALIDKKRGEGAIVGGLIGAGAGAGTGAIIDHNKKKKNKQ